MFKIKSHLDFLNEVNAITSLTTTSSLFQIYCGDPFNTLQFMKQISYWVLLKVKVHLHKF